MVGELVYGGSLADLGSYASDEIVGGGDDALGHDYHDRGYINADVAMNAVDLVVAEGVANVHANVVVIVAIVAV